MLYRFIKFRPSARAMDVSRRPRITCTLGAFCLKGRVSIGMVNRRNFVVALIKTSGAIGLGRTILTFRNTSAGDNCFKERRALYNERAILRVRHYRVQINALLRVCRSFNYAHVNDHENGMCRIFCPISAFFRQRSSAIRRHVNVSADVDNFRTCNEQDGIEVLFRKGYVG